MKFLGQLFLRAPQKKPKVQAKISAIIMFQSKTQNTVHRDWHYFGGTSLRFSAYWLFNYCLESPIVKSAAIAIKSLSIDIFWHTMHVWSFKVQVAIFNTFKKIERKSGWSLNLCKITMGESLFGRFEPKKNSSNWLDWVITLKITIFGVGRWVFF